MIEFRVDGRSGVATYLQLVQQVKHALRLGILDVGDQLPTVKEVVGHLCEAGSAVDALLRHAYLDRQRELPVRASIDPGPEMDLSPPLPDLLQNFARVRRRTVDLLRGLSEADWRQAVFDPEQGRLTLLDVCGQVTRHELGHLSQLRNLTALLPE